MENSSTQIPDGGGGTRHETDSCCSGPDHHDAVRGSSSAVNTKLLSIGTILLVVASVLLYQSITTYMSGLAKMSYTSGTGKVLTVNTHFNSFDTSKTATIKFPADNKEYVAEVDVPTDRVVKDGEVIHVYYDKNNPTNACLFQEIDYDNTIVRGAFGLFALCFGVLIFKRSLPNK